MKAPSSTDPRLASQEQSRPAPSRLSWFKDRLLAREIRLIVLPYLVFATLWILLSDTLLAWLVSDPALRVEISIAKGWLFVLVTSLLLYLLLRIERASRQKTEQRLHEQEYIYRVLTENASDVIWLFDLNTERLEYISPSVTTMRGFSPEECLKQSLAQTLSPTSLALAHKFISEHTSEYNLGLHAPSNASHILELEHTCRWGGYVTMEGTLRILPGPDGKAAKIVGVSRDITERKRISDELQRQKAWLERAEHIGRIGGWTLNLTTKQLWGSHEACNIYGVNTQTSNMARIADLPLQEYRAMLDSKLEGLILRGEPYDVEFRIRRPLNGAIADVHSIAEYDATNSTVYGVIQDVTERKKMESQLLRAQRLDSIGSLASGIAHDLNNILSPILLSTPMIREELTNTDALAMVDLVEASARRASDVVRQVLTFARGAHGEQKRINPRLALQEMLSFARESFPSNIGLDLTLKDDLWPIVGDPTQIHQVLINLFVNARDAMPSGGRITVSGENIPAEELKALPGERLMQGPYIRITISDTGAGMTEEVQQRLFEPFFSTKPQGKGTGLGLSTALGIMRGHHGCIRVRTTLGQGTHMDLYFPANQIATPTPSPESCVTFSAVEKPGRNII